MADSPGPGTLYLVATPIGNLEDVTLRALRILKEADLVAAEDTRRTRKLLTHYGISTKLVSCHEHNEAERIPALVEALRSGKSVALVSDAGSPGVSDPGARLVCAAAEAGLPVTAVPGPSAVTAALALAGLPADRFSFYGFLPRTRSRRRALLERAADEPHTLLFFESPRRAARTVAEMLEVFGNRRAALCRELTKQFEEVLRGTLEAILGRIEATQPRGEICLVVEGKLSTSGARRAASEKPEPPEEIGHELERLLADGFSLKEAARKLAAVRGLSRREVYQSALRRKEEKQVASGTEGKRPPGGRNPFPFTVS